MRSVLIKDRQTGRKAKWDRGRDGNVVTTNQGGLPEAGTGKKESPLRVSRGDIVLQTSCFKL